MKRGVKFGKEKEEQTIIDKASLSHDRVPILINTAGFDARRLLGTPGASMPRLLSGR